MPQWAVDQLRREQACIQAIHNKPWWRVGILHRKPWRATWKPDSLRSLIDWLRVAHDCSDPAIACSCSGSFRFPNR